MLSKVKNILNQLKVKKSGGHKGQSLVEMAIAAPILIFLLIGVFEVGWAIRSYVVLVNVNREITRFAVRPAYLDFETKDTISDSYEKVRNWVFTSLSDQLDMDFSEPDGNATLIVSHIVVDTGLPCEDMDKCDCSKFNPNDSNYDPNYKETFWEDDRIYHPDQPDQSFQAQRFGPAETVTGKRETRLDYDAIAADLKPKNNFFNCQIMKKGGIPSSNNAIFTELFLDQPQLFGFPLVSNPFTDPVPLYTHTSMRLTCGARSTGSSDNNISCGVDTVGPACEAYPITFPESTFGADPDAAIGTQFDAYEGDSPGNWGWITWNPDNGNNNAGYVAQELRYPQMSRTDFTDVNDPNDHQLTLNDDVSTKPGVANSSEIDDLLQGLVGKTILVPVFSNNPGSGSGSYYEVSHFAVIRVDQICLPRNGQTCDGEAKKQITATFMGHDDERCGPDTPGGGATNNPPVAADDSATTTKNTPVTINVVTNDSDPDGDSLTVSDVSITGDGKVTNNNDGTVEYEPKNNKVGTFTFTYTISDGNGGTDTATVTVTVTN